MNGSPKRITTNTEAFIVATNTVNTACYKIIGGGEGNRTPVRKTYDLAFYIVIPSFDLTISLNNGQTSLTAIP